MRQSIAGIRLKKLAALAVVVTLYWASRLPGLPADDRGEMATRFQFSRVELARLPGAADRKVRAVHPSLERISGWISSVGAAVALMDLDRDGLANEICHVDPRSDQVIVSPAPGSGERFAAFELAPLQMPFDASTMAPSGCLPGDFNEDGLLDLLVYYWGRTPLLFLQREPGPAEPVSLSAFEIRELVATGERWYTNAATRADLDGDGRIDLILGNYFQDGARILDKNAPKHPREEMQDSMSRAYNGGGNRVFLGLGSGAQDELFWPVEGIFDDSTAYAWTLGIGAADLDGDLLPELYFANDFGPDRLLHNRSRPGELRFEVLRGIKTLTTPNSKVINRDSFKGMGVDFGDLNGDGWLDIYVSNIADVYALQESHFLFLSTGRVESMQAGLAPYHDQSEALGLSRSGWGWETRFGDFDNDGVLEALQATGFLKGRVDRWPELHEIAMGNDELLKLPGFWPRFGPGDDLSGHQHNPFFVRAPSGRYFDMAADSGVDQLQVTRGIATADIEGDGDLDFVVANQWEDSFLYRNQAPGSGAFLGLHLLLPVEPAPTGFDVRPGHPDRSLLAFAAIGAQAEVSLSDGRRLVAQVDGGNGHSGVRSPALHFGLGGQAPGTRVEVKLSWRGLGGETRRETVSISPGWHTVILQKENEGDDK